MESSAEIIQKISASIGQFFTPGKKEILTGVRAIHSTAAPAFFASPVSMARATVAVF